MNMRLQINKDFINLISPYTKKEYLALEEKLLAEGCTEPIITWNGYIIDGMTRYEICLRHDIPYNVKEMRFSCKEAAYAFVCKKQLLRRDLTFETRKFLIGMQYEAEKYLHSTHPRGYSSWHSRADNLSLDGVEYRESPTRHTTAQRIADENQVTHATVQKYAIYTKALLTIGSKYPEILPKILAGRLKLSHQRVVELSKLSPTDLRRADFGAEQKPYHIQMNQAHRGRPPKNSSAAPPIPARPSVKDMPAFDPDAPAVELSLTVPSWTSSIKRAQKNINAEVVSDRAKEKLREVLGELIDTAAEILMLIKEE